MFFCCTRFLQSIGCCRCPHHHAAHGPPPLPGRTLGRAVLLCGAAGGPPGLRPLRIRHEAIYDFFRHTRWGQMRESGWPPGFLQARQMYPDTRKRMASRISPGAADVPRYAKAGILKCGIVQSSTCRAPKSLLTK